MYLIFHLHHSVEAAYVSEIFCSPFSDYGLLSMVDPLTNGYYFFKGNLLIHKKGKLEINKKLHILIDLGHATISL